MYPTVTVLTIGNELLDGDIADSNTQRIAEILAPYGFQLYQRISVCDDSDAIAEALLYLTGSSDIIIVSGGLGPTRDDLTAAATARVLQRPLSKNQEALDMVRRFFQKFGRPMTERQEKQAWLPEDAGVLNNPIGSAPGFFLCHGYCLLFFLPGVPTEMAAMLKKSVIPLLYENFPEITPWGHKTFKLLGMPESTAESMLDTLNLPEEIQIGICVKLPFVHVRIGIEEKEDEGLLGRISADIRALYGDHLVAEDDETLKGHVAKLLMDSGHTLSLAESCTGGWIAKMLTDIPGASAFLERGAVSYSNQAKHDWLDVPKEVLDGSGAVSEECALAMARGIRQASRTDFALAVTGIAGPDGGSPEKPVGTVYIALADEKQEKAIRFQFPGNRDNVRLRTACTALNLLRCRLAELNA